MSDVRVLYQLQHVSDTAHGVYYSHGALCFVYYVPVLFLTRQVHTDHLVFETVVGSYCTVAEAQKAAQKHMMECKNDQ